MKAKPFWFRCGAVYSRHLSTQLDHQVAFHLFCWDPDQSDPRAVADQVSAPRSAPRSDSFLRQRSINSSPFPPVFSVCDPSPFMSALMINPSSVLLTGRLERSWETTQLSRLGLTALYNFLADWLTTVILFYFFCLEGISLSRLSIGSGIHGTESRKHGIIVSTWLLSPFL